MCTFIRHSFTLYAKVLLNNIDFNQIQGCWLSLSEITVQYIWTMLWEGELCKVYHCCQE